MRETLLRKPDVIPGVKRSFTGRRVQRTRTPRRQIRRGALAPLELAIEILSSEDRAISFVVEVEQCARQLGAFLGCEVLGLLENGPDSGALPRIARMTGAST